ncbi:MULTISPECIES: hypothetical protein [unclassified Thermotoga]|uniref:hypothetical protein n=1 Tax=unclassified Thermotoga TaxID=2631113 RepID=UPI000280EA0B|nr:MULTISPECIES: hypothetical protein [unclassified Thermotoga]AIY85963.1 hypothetical protein T2812B_02070 [Thermotoga sp. 2812B]EJX26752.1 hypothetical protein EMP_00707 [Thermotoga sp. EMP]
MRILLPAFLLLLAVGCTLVSPGKADLYVYLFNVGTDESVTVDLESSYLSVNGKEYTLEDVLANEGVFLTTVDIPFDLSDFELTVAATIVFDEQTKEVSFKTTPVVLYHSAGTFSTDTVLRSNAYLLLDLKNEKIFAVEDPVKVYGELTSVGSVVTLNFGEYEMKVPVYNGEFLFYLPGTDESYYVDVFFDSDSTSLTIQEGRDEYEVAF